MRVCFDLTDFLAALRCERDTVTMSTSACVKYKKQFFLCGYFQMRDRCLTFAFINLYIYIIHI